MFPQGKMKISETNYEKDIKYTDAHCSKNRLNDIMYHIKITEES